MEPQSRQIPKLILPHGGYRKLRSFQVARLVFDETVIFCERFIRRNRRTCDQMIQAARSGAQNIAEVSKASATSKKSEMFLTNVALSSQEELLLDYEDFLRQRGLPQWPARSPKAQAVRRRYKSDLSDLSDLSDTSDPYGIAAADAETAANIMICLTNQAIYLARQQLQRLEKDFVEKGGFTERLYNVRSRARRNKPNP